MVEGMHLLRILKVVRTMICIGVLLYLFGLWAAVLGMRFVGQGNVTTATLLFVPPLLLIGPGILLIPFSLISGWRTAVLLCASIGGYFFLHLDYQLNPGTAAAGSKVDFSLKIMTWNRGQSKGVSLQPLKNDWKPDFILLQDAGGTERYYKGNKAYHEFPNTAGVGEFVLLSRWPIVSAESFAPSRKRSRSGAPVHRAARFVVAALGQRCVIYSVHLESPRDTLDSYKRGAFLWGILGFPGSPWEEKRLHYQPFWDEQLEVAGVISERVRTEFGPVIVAGDFNSPGFGPMHRLFSKQLSDAHQESGEGFGYTFPGVTNNPLSLMQPWLRLDQIFTSKHCKTVSCRAIPVNGQHLPVLSEFVWHNGPEPASPTP